MAHYGILGGTAIAESGEDIRGAHLYGANDEKLGKLEDVIFDHSTGEIQYVVVDTGGWLTSKKFIVPSERLCASAKHEDDFEASLTRQQVESFPPYRQSDLESEKKWNDYEGRYRAKWVADPVMHRAETDRNITPTTQQQLGERFVRAGRGGSTRIADRAAARSGLDRTDPGGSGGSGRSNRPNCSGRRRRGGH